MLALRDAVMRLAVPCFVVMVELAAGLRLFTNLVEVTPQAMRVGMTRHLALIPTEGGSPVLMFVPGAISDPAAAGRSEL